MGYIDFAVQLNDEERNDLNTLLRKGHAKARTLTHARILLSDEGKTDPAIADALKVNPQTGVFENRECGGVHSTL